MPETSYVEFTKPENFIRRENTEKARAAIVLPDYRQAGYAIGGRGATDEFSVAPCHSSSPVKAASVLSGVIQKQGHTAKWNNYTRGPTDRINNVNLPAKEGASINLKIEKDIRSAADRYKDIHIAYGSVIVISSPKAMFHFSIDPDTMENSHFTFETYNAGYWLNTAAEWQSAAVSDVVSHAGEKEQWLLERQGII